METSEKNFKVNGRIGTSRKGEIYIVLFSPRSRKHFLNKTFDVGVLFVKYYSGSTTLGVSEQW